MSKVGKKSKLIKINFGYKNGPSRDLSLKSVKYIILLKINGDILILIEKVQNSILIMNTSESRSGGKEKNQ